MVNVGEVGTFLEKVAASGNPINYGDVIARFPDLPPLAGAWLAHPLRGIFGELDEQDAVAKRPFRTAMVIAKERNMPGPGFFKTISRLRGRQILKSEELTVWTDELRAVLVFYAAGEIKRVDIQPIS